MANCSDPSSPALNALTDYEFTYGGDIYTIVDLHVSAGRDLTLAFEGMTCAAAKTALGALTLKVDDHKLAFSSASAGSDGRLTWPFSNR